MAPAGMSPLARAVKAGLLSTVVAVGLLTGPTPGRAAPAAPGPSAARGPSAAPAPGTAATSATLATGERVELVPDGRSGPSFRVTPPTPGERVGAYAFGVADGTLRVQPSGRTAPVGSVGLATHRGTTAGATATPRAAAATHKVSFTVPELPGAEQKLLYVWNRAGWVAHSTASPEFSRFATANLPAGDYVSIALLSAWAQPSYLLVKTFTVKAATKVTFPAKAVETRIAVDDPTARRTGSAVWISVPNGGLAGFAGGYDGGKIYVTPFSVPGMSLRLHEILTKAGGQASSPYRYDLFHTFPDTVPATPVAKLSTAKLAKTVTTVRAQGHSVDGQLLSVPDAGDSSGVYLSSQISVPSTITEYVTPDRSFSRIVHIGSYDYALSLAPRTLSAGGNPTETIGAAPINAGVAPVARSYRDGNTLRLYEYSAFGDAAGNTGADHRSTMSARVTSGGRTLATVTNGSPFAPLRVDVDSEEATYELEHTVNRRVLWSRLGSTVQSVWTWRSARTTRFKDLPLVDISFTASGLDDWNAAGAAPVQITASAATREIEAVETLTGLEYSTDDGATWTALPVSGSSSSTSGTLVVPSSAAYVSLRATARNDEGGSLKRTVIRAFAGPAQTGDESAGATTISKVKVNGGKPFVFGTPDTHFGGSYIPVTFTVSDPAKVASADVSAYRGTYARRTAMLTGRAECQPAATGVSTCTADLYLDTLAGPAKNSLAGTWSVNVLARSGDGNGFVDRRSAGSLVLARRTTLTADAAPEPVRRGRKITVTGTLALANWETRAFTGWPGQPVQLQFRKSGAAAYTVVKMVKSGARGAVKTTVTANADGAWRYVFTGTPAYAAGASAGDAVDVR